MPRRKSNPPIANENQWRSTIKAFIEEEMAGVDAYRQLLLRIQGQGDNTKMIRNVINGIIKDEENHIKILTALMYL